MAGWFPLFAPSNLLTARSLLGGFDANGNSYAFNNICKLMTSPVGNLQFASLMNTDGYPIVDLSVAGTTGISYGLPAVVSSGTSLGNSLPASLLGSGVTWVLSWSGKGGVNLVNSAGVTVTSSNTSVTNGSYTNTSPAGTNGRVEFYFDPATTSITLSFSQFISYGTPGGGNTMSNLQLYRKSQENGGQTGPNATFAPEFRSLIQALNPKILRMMDWGHTNFSNVSRWAYRSASTALSYTSTRYDTTLSGGTTGGTSTAYTCSNPSASGAGAYVNGETVQVQFHTANTTTTPTLNVNGRGAVTIEQNYTAALSVGTIATNAMATLVYDAWLNVWLGDFGQVSSYSGGGLFAGVPLEAQVELCNTLNINLWYNFPFHYDDASITSAATYVRNNLNANLTAYFEYTNEHWNNLFSQFSLCQARGAYLGFPNSSGRQENGYFALRNKQIMDLVTAAWSPRSTSTLRRVMATGAASDPNGVQTYQWNGSDLDTGLGYTNYNSAIGQNYHTGSPTFSRPIDNCDVVSYATYYSGPVLNNGGGYAVNSSNLSTADVSAFTAAVDANDLNYADNQFRKGIFNITTCSLPGAISANVITATNNFVNSGGNNGDVIIFSSSGALPTGISANTAYYAVNQSGSAFQVATTRGGTAFAISGGTGTLTIGSLGGGTLLFFNTPGVRYAAWETVIAAYDGARNSGFLNLKTECYEGALEAIAPTTAQCTAMSISTSYAAATATYLDNYKNNALAYQLVIDQFTQFMGQAHSVTPAWFALQGPSNWSLMPSDTYSTPYQLYYGNKAYNS